MVQQVRCPFCSAGQTVDLPRRIRETVSLRPICRSCGRMFLAVIRPGILKARIRVHPL